MSDYYRINYLIFMEPHRVLGTNAMVSSNPPAPQVRFMEPHRIPRGTLEASKTLLKSRLGVPGPVGAV